jgi:feruloyl-CoA synthase
MNPPLKETNPEQTVKYRQMSFGVTRAVLTKAADFDVSGVQYLRAEQSLQPYALRITDQFLYWVKKTPDHTLFAQRELMADGSRGEWQKISFQQALDKARAIGEGLVARRLNADRPVAILSDNDLDHAMLKLACIYAGVPYCSISSAYSLLSHDFAKLKHILGLLKPGLVFAADFAKFGKAIEGAVALGTEVIDSKTLQEQFINLTPGDAVDKAMEATGPDSIVKFLFTSGSTKMPKGVINTQRMWCANQQMMRQSMPVIAEHQPVLVDWLPWNHTFGGNHNFGMVLYNGGTLYIDNGKPTPALMGETIRNLREIAPTLYFNVPTGFEALANAMKTDDQLRKNLLSKVQMFFYSGAALSASVWADLHSIAEKEVGERIVMGTGLGMTESSPFALFVTNPQVTSGDIGLPTPGVVAKLIPDGDKTEIRYAGPSITPGYWKMPEQTAESFDDEGYFLTGDAVKWIAPDNIHLGLKFDGRTAEDFKLATGTFVSVGPLRAKIQAAGAPYVQDAVITGINRNELGALLFLFPKVRELSGLGSDASWESVVTSAPVQTHFQGVIKELAAQATGSATRVSKMILLVEPPSIDSGEMTDKGSINQRAVLKNRDNLVQAMHEGTLAFIIGTS